MLGDRRQEFGGRGHRTHALGVHHVGDHVGDVEAPFGPVGTELPADRRQMMKIRVGDENERNQNGSRMQTRVAKISHGTRNQRKGDMQANLSK